ncbi:LysM peptidoglycan-binding domain-containing protein [Cerasicoccus maritimus]|uniref:LysM peptidoglycan-binding domain-containing protein n=1 Tax=Cerasicoccus maritimus TaxID=490089 RepID=UPI002852AAC1|nr:LysM peptidoglycan-binding domain-containing protein [Cerasicoccus maritimus]
MNRFLFLCLAVCCPLFASAQSTAFARMAQDVQLLQEQVGQLSVQVESLQRQQLQMIKNYEALLKQQAASTASLNNFVAQTETKLAALPEREAAAKREILAEVNKEIQALAKQTQDGFKKLAQAMNATPNITPQVNFDEDYPTTGYTHEVKSGETISGIAKKYGSSIKDIMNANRIADATGLKAGETIFVPVKE